MHPIVDTGLRSTRNASSPGSPSRDARTAFAPADEGRDEPEGPKLEWNEDIEALVLSWGKRAVTYRELHEMAASRASFYNNCLGVPVLLLTAIAGTVSFGNSDESNHKALSIFIGIVSMSASAITGVQNFLKLQQRTEQHKQMASRFSSFYREIDAELTMPRPHRKDAYDFVHRTRTVMDKLLADGPSIPASVQRKYDALKSLVERRRADAASASMRVVVDAAS